MTLTLLLLAALLPFSTTAQESAKAAEITFHFEHPGLAVPVFTLRIQQDGGGEYFGDELLPSDKTTPRPFRRPIALSAATTRKIFSAAKSLREFHATCASSAKGIADTGIKTLSYTGPAPAGSCTYNYSDNKTVQGLTDTLLAVAYTLDMGRKLDFDHRFDRLGLDAQTAFLAQELKEGRAADLLTISTTLESIASDAEVIQRVRLRAASLLQKAREETPVVPR